VKRGNGQEAKVEQTEQATECKIKEAFVNIVKEHKIIFTDWLEGDSPEHMLQMMGYKSYTPQNVVGRGNVRCWIHGDIVKEDGNIKNQTEDHYSTVAQLAGLLIDIGFENVVIHHSNDVDVSGELHGVTYGFEYEHAGSHNKPELIEKKRRSMQLYNEVLFIGSTANEEQLIEAVGNEYVRRRGAQLKKWLDEKTTSVDSKTQESKTRLTERLITECEANEAI
jgi:hypothetical protein